MAPFYPGSDPTFHSGNFLSCTYILQELCVKSKIWLSIHIIQSCSVYYIGKLLLQIPFSWRLQMQSSPTDTHLNNFLILLFASLSGSFFSCPCELQHSWLCFQDFYLPLAQLWPFSDCWHICSQFQLAGLSLQLSSGKKKNHTITPGKDSTW